MVGIPQKTCYIYSYMHNNPHEIHVARSKTRDYGSEQRFNTTGFLGTRSVTICHTENADEIHIISLRKAEQHEIDTLARYL